MSKKLISLFIIFSFFIQINKCTQLEFQTKLREKRFLRALTDKFRKVDHDKGRIVNKRDKNSDNEISHKVFEVKAMLIKTLDKLDSLDDLVAGGQKYILNKEVLWKEKPSNKERKQRQQVGQWGNWTEWSTCSVSCGKGREIRWRHCLSNCEEAETEMEEKTCQLPSCPPGKLFGLFKL